MNYIWVEPTRAKKGLPAVVVAEPGKEPRMVKSVSGKLTIGPTPECAKSLAKGVTVMAWGEQVQINE